MRNAQRIALILEELHVLWKNYPDLRLGQLLLNAFDDPNSLYFIEDEQLIKALWKTYKQYDKPNKKKK